MNGHRLACPRCGAPVVTLAELARSAVTALAAYERMRLSVPDELARSIRMLAASLPCQAGTCVPKEACRGR
jgi:hypothetical protein